MATFDFVSGEEIILRATLKKNGWMKYRCVTCSIRCIATAYLAPICVPLYACLGDSCREDEANSFDLVLTNQNLHYRQKLYGCGFFCQQTQTKVIPLNRIQDISLVSDWLGDNCGIVDTPGEVYQLQVQTAAMGTPMPELFVACIDNPREFKRKVMEAKNALAAAEANAGQAKGGALQQTLNNASPEDLARILALLARQPTEQKPAV